MRLSAPKAGLLTVAIVALLSGPAATQGGTTPFNVVELFTSQSCSSCPPADELLGRLSEDETILALSYSVDYWDYLEWKDTLARPEFSARQKGYAKARRDRAVYTPQAVINGATHAVGSDAEAIRRAFRSTLAGADNLEVDLDIDRQGNSIVISAGSAPKGVATKPATVWLVIYVNSATVQIGAGENEGRTVTYRNAVRRLEPVADWTGEPLTVTIAMPEAKGKRCAVLLQEGSEAKPGRILAAERLAW